VKFILQKKVWRNNFRGKHQVQKSVLTRTLHYSIMEGSDATPKVESAEATPIQPNESEREEQMPLPESDEAAQVSDEPPKTEEESAQAEEANSAEEAQSLKEDSKKESSQEEQAKDEDADGTNDAKE
jgi:hypothetical protein